MNDDVEPDTQPPPTWPEAYVHFMTLTFYTFKDMTTWSIVGKVVVFPILLIVSTNYMFPQHVHTVIWIYSGIVVIPILIIGLLVAPFLSKMFLKNRQSAFDSAKSILRNRIQTGRAIRFNGYDVFLPPQKTTQLQSKISNNETLPA